GGGRRGGGGAEGRWGRCVEEGGGVCGCAPPCLVAAVADHQRVRLAVDAQLELASVGHSCRPRADGERVCEPTRSQRFPALWPVHESQPPFGELVDDGSQGPTVVGQPLHPGSGGRGELLPRHDAGLLELPEAHCEHVCTDTWEAVEQVGVALGSEEQFPYYEDRPPIADHVECAGDRTEL